MIEEIIRKYLDNDLPEEVQDEFEAWMLDPGDVTAKDRALMDCFNSLHPETDCRKLNSKFNKLQADIDREEGRKKKRRITRIGYVIAAASLLFAFLTFEFIILKGKWSSGAKQVFITSVMNKGEFSLPDGSTVFLNSSSRLEVPEYFTGKTRSVRLDGEAYFNIVHDSVNPFIVSSHMVNLKVLGTSFNIRAYDADEFAEVVLVNGSLEVSGGSLPEPVRLRPNEKLTVDRTPRIEEVNTCHYTSWTGTPLTIDNMPLGDILTNIEHWYNVSFVPVGATDLSPHLSFVIRDESLDNILEQISRITSFRYYVKQHKIYYSTE